MAIICRELRLLFIMVPGTGCSVFGNTLLSDFGGEWLPEQDLVIDGMGVHPRKHNSVQQLVRDGLLSPEDRDSYLVAANIRNPFDRLVTYYQRIAGNWSQYSADVRLRALDR